MTTNQYTKLDANHEVIRRDTGGGSQPQTKDNQHEPSDVDRLLPRVRLWHTPNGEPWVTVQRGHNFRIDAPEFTEWVAGELFHMTNKAPNRSQLDAIRTQLSAYARFRGPEHQVHLRVAREEDELWLDLADQEGHAIRITAVGYEILKGSDVPVKFARPKDMQPLPIPASQPDVSALRALLNLHNDGTFKLLVTWLAFCLVADSTYPVLAITGPHGAAKSTFSRIVRATVDPNIVPLHGAPRGQDLVAIAKNNHLVCFDNLSTIRPDLADDLCRLATGGGFGGRRFYTNDDVASYQASRPTILNGINDMATRGDLADRTLLIHLPSIPPRMRRQERDVWRAFELARPAILAALIEMASLALRRLPNITMPPDGWPRMADFAAFGIATAPALGWSGDDFVRAYALNRDAAIEAVIDDDPVISGVLIFLDKQPSKIWSGTANQLLSKLQQQSLLAAEASNFPKSPELLGKALRRAEPILAARGIIVDYKSTNSARIITLRSVTVMSDAA